MRLRLDPSLTIAPKSSIETPPAQGFAVLLSALGVEAAPQPNPKVSPRPDAAKALEPTTARPATTPERDAPRIEDSPPSAPSPHRPKTARVRASLEPERAPPKPMVLTAQDDEPMTLVARAPHEDEERAQASPRVVEAPPLVALALVIPFTPTTMRLESAPAPSPVPVKSGEHDAAPAELAPLVAVTPEPAKRAPTRPSPVIAPKPRASRATDEQTDAVPANDVVESEASSPLVLPTSIVPAPPPSPAHADAPRKDDAPPDAHETTETTVETEAPAPVTHTPQATAKPLTIDREQPPPAAPREPRATSAGPARATPLEASRTSKDAPVAATPSTRAQQVLDLVKLHVAKAERSTHVDIGHGESRVRATIHVDEHRVTVHLVTADPELRSRLQTGLITLARDLEKRGLQLDRTASAATAPSDKAWTRAVTDAHGARFGARDRDRRERDPRESNAEEDDSEPTQTGRRTIAGRTYLR